MHSGDFRPVVMRRRKASRYAEGGLAGEAEAVRGAGRGGDDFVVHLNGKELATLAQQFGPPTVNPQTGLPEFFLGDLFKDNGWLAPVLGIGASVLGAGSFVGDGLNSALGLGLETGGVGANALGSALVGGGIGALTGGTKGAIMGGLAGGATPFVGSMFGGGGGGALNFNSGDINVDGASPGGTTTGSALGFGGASGGGGGLLGGSGLNSFARVALPAAMIASAFHGAGKDKSGPTAEQKVDASRNQAQMERPLSQVQFARTRTPMPVDPRSYGLRPSHDYYNNNRLPQMARGGKPRMAQAPRGPALPSRYVDGPGTGRSDSIPARVARGEYILDSETVSLLGDGSSEAGASLLDSFRENIRKHKGAALAKGKFSPNAKPPASYLKRGGF
jgi:hypothetical protein